MVQATAIHQEPPSIRCGEGVHVRGLKCRPAGRLGKRRQGEAAAFSLCISCLDISFFPSASFWLNRQEGRGCWMNCGGGALVKSCRVCLCACAFASSQVAGRSSVSGEGWRETCTCTIALKLRWHFNDTSCGVHSIIRLQSTISRSWFSSPADDALQK